MDINTSIKVNDVRFNPYILTPSISCGIIVWLRECSQELLGAYQTMFSKAYSFNPFCLAELTFSVNVLHA